MGITQLISGGFLTGEMVLEMNDDLKNGKNKENNNDSPTNDNVDQSTENHKNNTKNKPNKRHGSNHSRQPKLIDIIVKTVCNCINIVSLHLSVTYYVLRSIVIVSFIIFDHNLILKHKCQIPITKLPHMVTNKQTNKTQRKKSGLAFVTHQKKSGLTLNTYERLNIMRYY